MTLGTMLSDVEPVVRKAARSRNGGGQAKLLPQRMLCRL
jgi:hypothetical protein